MSIFGLLDNLISRLDRVGAVGSAASGFVRAAHALGRLASRHRVVTPPPFPRAHQWNHADPRACAFCQRELTRNNEYSPCPGAPPRAQ